MSIITFWSPDHGRGNTANCAAIGAMIGLEYDIRTLIARTHFGDSRLEDVFLKPKELQLKNLVTSAATGMDSVERLFKTKRLDASGISNYALSLQSGRLDILTGTSRADASGHEGIEHVFAAIFDEAKRYYQAIILDVAGGCEHKVSNQLIQSADLVVINLSQDMKLFERYVCQEKWPTGLQSKSKIILLGQYDPHSKYNVANIRRKFGIRDPIFAIPYCSDYRDAFNDKDVLGWFRRVRHADRRQGSYSFCQEVRKCAKEMLSQIGVNTEIKRIERGVS